MTPLKLMIPLASANSFTTLPIHTTMKGINKTLLRHTELNVSALIPQSVPTHSPPPPLHTSILPLLHFDRWPILAPMLSSPHDPTLLQTILFPSRARIPPDSHPSLSIHPRGPKRSLVLARCPWIPQLLVAPPSRTLLSFLLPSPATFPWRIPQIPPLSQPTPRSVCDRPSHPSLVPLSTVLIHRDVNVIHQNLRLSRLSSRILFLLNRPLPHKIIGA
jgi:hypothetical protein